MVYGIVLSGGYSSRAKTNKMVLKWNGEYLINHVILAMKDVVDRVIVVTGYYHYDIVKAVERFDDVTVIRNEAYQNGMFSSIKTGVRLVEGDFFINLVNNQ